MVLFILGMFFGALLLVLIYAMVTIGREERKNGRR